MMSTKILFTCCLLLQTAGVFGNAWGATHGAQTNRATPSGHVAQNHTEAVTYDTTVTTEMGYYESEDSEDEFHSGKGRGNHDEYEYVSASPKSGKKGGHRTHSPSHEPKDNKKVGPRTHSPTQVGSSYATAEGNTPKGHLKPKASKKGRSSKKGGKHPIVTPHPSAPLASSEDYPSSRPPFPITEPNPGARPTLAPAESPDLPSTTASPTDEDSVAFDLDPFSLLYDTVTKQQASRDDLAEVTDVTRLYLEDFMFDEFSGSSFTFLDDFITGMITSTFLSGDEPYVVDYSATARFNPFSTVFPSTDQLNEALATAFSGSNMAEYERRLTGLSEDNVFYGASSSFGEPVVRVSREPSNNAAAIAAGAVAATLLAAGAVLYKRRMQAELDEKDLNKGKGDSTVAGDTFAGETYDGSASVSASSFEHPSRYRDEDRNDEAIKGHNMLGTIEEDEDGDSVRPAWGATSWGANLSFDDEDADAQTLQKSVTMDDKSMGLDDTDDRVIRRAATEGSTVTAIATDGGVTAVQLFDEMALQGLSRVSDDDDDDDSSHASHAEDIGGQEELGLDATPEVASVLSPNNTDERSIARTVSSSSSSRSSRRPKTVEEIEAMLTADSDDYDEESNAFSSRSRSFGNDNATIATSQRPRTVEEIESLLSAGMDDDCAEGIVLD